VTAFVDEAAIQHGEPPATKAVEAVAFLLGERLGCGIILDVKVREVLKGLITDPVVNVEGNYKTAVNVPNMLHIGMASNQDWVVPASIDERRYCVFDVSPHRIGDRGYFQALADQMKDGGTAAMLHDLLAIGARGACTVDRIVTKGMHEEGANPQKSLRRFFHRGL
jgi:hypothetical protein